LISLACGCNSTGGRQTPSPGTTTSGPRFIIPETKPIEPISTTGTLRAREIELVDERGRATMTLSGQMMSGGPTITFHGGGDDEKDEALMILAAGRSGLKRDGPPMALIHAESGDHGNVQLVVEPDGAHIYMGSDDTDGFEITCGKDGVLVAVEPKEEPGTTVGSPGSRSRREPESKQRGVRITIEQGKVVVRDLSGRELGVLPDPAPTPPAPK
jgi:hypothetical protein